MTWMDFIAEQWLLVSLLLVLVVAFVVVESKKGGKSITYNDVARLMNNDEAVVLDVRDAADFKAGAIIDATNIPYASLSGRVAELEKHKQKTIIIADKMGQHAGAAGKILQDAGFSTLKLQGGMAEWLAQNLPVVKQGKPAKKEGKKGKKSKEG